MIDFGRISTPGCAGNRELDTVNSSENPTPSSSKLSPILRTKPVAGPRPVTLALVTFPLLLLLTPEPAAAYIDPVTGSIILQVLAALALGAVLTVKRVWAVLAEQGKRVWDGVSGVWRR